MRSAALLLLAAADFKRRLDETAKSGKEGISCKTSSGGPIRSADGADNIGTALLLELPDLAAADKFWNEEPFAKNGGYQRDSRIVRWVFGD